MTFGVIPAPSKSELANEPLIYERADGINYARFADEPKRSKYNGRWIIGGDPIALAKLNGELFSYGEWQEMMELSLKYPILKNQMKKLIEIYYLVKDE
jgi:hypothetical protein